MNKQKVIVYVDGFNFYYGLKGDPKWKRYYWLDIVKFFEKFMKPDQELIKVKYFSARPDNQEKNARQYAFFQANMENSRFQLILGKYLKNIAIVVSADSDMIPSVELAKQAGQKVFIYFPPNHYSSNLAALANGHPIQLSKYESRFRQSLLPDVVHLKEKNYDLSIPEKWKKLR